MKVVEYLDPAGRSPFEAWFRRIEARAAAKVTVALARLEGGNLSNTKTVGSGVLEYRIDYGPGYRVSISGAMERRWSSCLPAARSSASSGILPTPRPAGSTTNAGSVETDMALTRDFKQSIKARVVADPAYGTLLLAEAVELLLAGDMETGKSVMRDYINATVGFEALALATGTPAKSLMRMFGPKGNPRADNLFAVIGALQKANGVNLAVGVAA